MRRTLLALVVVGVGSGIGAAYGLGASGSSPTKVRTVGGGRITTPANQPALDKAAQDARRIAGDQYYAGAVIDDRENFVELYLSRAPRSILRQLRAKHPGLYRVVDNRAS